MASNHSNRRFAHAGRILWVAASLFLTVTARASIVLYDQMTNCTSVIIPSSWFAPNGLDGDTYAWDNFRLPKPADVTEVWWVGGGGNISGVTVRFYEGLASAPDYQPKITALPESETEADYLKGYRFTLAETNPVPLGGGLYSYHVNLPTVMHLPGNKVFWVKIEGDCTNGYSWGIAQASHGRDGMHFRFITGGLFQRITGDLAFQLKGNVTTFPRRGG